MLEDVLPCKTTLIVNAMAVKAANPSWEHMESRCMHISRHKAPMTTKATWALFVLLGDLAFEWQQGWSSPCFDTDLSAFVTE